MIYIKTLIHKNNIKSKGHALQSTVHIQQTASQAHTRDQASSHAHKYSSYAPVGSRPGP